MRERSVYGSLICTHCECKEESKNSPWRWSSDGTGARGRREEIGVRVRREEIGAPLGCGGE